MKYLCTLPVWYGITCGPSERNNFLIKIAVECKQLIVRQPSLENYISVLNSQNSFTHFMTSQVDDRFAVPFPAKAPSLHPLTTSEPAKNSTTKVVFTCSLPDNIFWTLFELVFVNPSNSGATIIIFQRWGDLFYRWRSRWPVISIFHTEYLYARWMHKINDNGRRCNKLVLYDFDA